MEPLEKQVFTHGLPSKNDEKNFDLSRDCMPEVKAVLPKKAFRR